MVAVVEVFRQEHDQKIDHQAREIARLQQRNRELTEKVRTLETKLFSFTSGSGSGSKGTGKKGNRSETHSGTTVRVSLSNLIFNNYPIDTQSVASAFGAAGNVISARGENNGMIDIVFETSRDADNAVNKFHGGTLDGIKIDVRKSR